MILLIDNYDSFVHNLARYLAEAGVDTLVVRNDALRVSEIREMQPAAMILSPGPCTPAESGVSREVVQKFADEIPMLGVCLGHQIIADAFGGRVVRASRPVHGQAWPIEHQGEGILSGIPSPFEAGRYHSLIVDRESLPEVLVPTAWTAEGILMALAHRDRPIFGVQFHPESVLTPCGRLLIHNFLGLAGIEHDSAAAELFDFAPPIADDDFFRREVAADAEWPLHRSATSRER